MSSSHPQIFVRPLKLLARSILLALAIIFGFISALIPFTGGQIQKNRLLLADMRDRVDAVREFHTRNLRLPTQREFTPLSASLPARSHLYDYQINQSGSSNDPFAPRESPYAGGWTLSIWRGEWNDFYSSWDNRYTLSDRLSYRAFWGWLLWSPLLAIGLLFLRRHRFLRDNKPT